MKITIKTLQQKLFTVDVEPEETVADIKSKITAEHGHPVENQRLIYSGKVLDDAKVVSTCHFKEKDFLVLMVSKAKAAPAAPAAPVASTSAATSSTTVPAASAPSETPAPVPVPAPAAVAVAPSTGGTETDTIMQTDTTDPAPAAPAAVPSPAPAGPSDPSFVTGAALETSIQNMMELGFPRDQVLRALRASFNNPDRAVEYLFSGIPEHLLAETAPRSPAAPTTPSTTTPSAAAPAAAATPAPAAQPAATGGTQNLFQMAQQQQQQQRAGAGAGAGLGAAGGLGALAGLGGAGRIPAGGAGGAGGGEGQEATDLRQLVAQNPAMLQHLIQSLVQNNPALAQAINNNPEMLFQLLGGGDDDEEGDMGGGGAPPGVQTIALTQEEMEAIQRLEALGFSRQEAAQAYLACGKNEELAANFLFEGGFTD